MGVDPFYFLDEMTSNEVSYIMNKHDENFKNEWNQTRQICYTIIQSQSTKSLQPTDVLRFPWDDVEVKDEVTPSKTREELIEYSKQLEKKLNQNGK